jgi:hypothetical protein
MKKIYDMSYIREHGINVLDNGYFWPVCESDFHDFSQYIFKEYQDLILSINDQKLISIALVETSFINLLVQIFHSNYVNNYAKANNSNVNISDFKEYLDPNWKEIGDHYKKNTFPHNRFVRILRSLIKYFVFNRKKNLILNIFTRKEKCISIGSSSKLKEMFVHNNNLCCSYYDFPDLFDNNLNLYNNENLVDKFEKEVINKLFDKINQKNSKFSLNFNFNEAKLSWLTRFKDATALYDSVKVPKNCKTLLITESAKPYHKIIIGSMKKQGVNVYCFHHGNDSALIIQDILHVHNVSHCQNFVTPSQNISKTYSKSYDHLKIDKFTKTKYISVEAKNKADILLNPINPIKTLKQKTVMIMGYPYNSSRYTDERGMFFLSKVDLEKRLIQQISKLGFRVIYKGHPDRKKEIEGVFDDIADEIDFSAFETSFTKADIIVFSYVSTTTFGYAIQTDKKILLICDKDNKVNKNQWKVLEKRVLLVRSSVDNNLKICYDVSELKEKIIGKRFEVFDMSYINEYI